MEGDGHIKDWLVQTGKDIGKVAGAHLKKAARRRPGRVDGKGRHDIVECPFGGREARHTGAQTELVAISKDAGAWVRRTNVQELRVLRSSRSQRQGDVAFDNFGPQQQTALTDLVVTHPTAATSSYRTGQSGVAAARQEGIKEGKYSEAAAAKGIRFIPFAMETYGKLGTKALRLLRTLGQDLADSNQPSALRPWHARSFMYGLSGAAAFCGLAAHDPARPGAAVTPAASAARRRAGGLFRVRRRCRLPPLFELAQRRRRQLPYTRPPWRKLPVTSTRAARLRPYV